MKSYFGLLVVVLSIVSAAGCGVTRIPVDYDDQAVVSEATDVCEGMMLRLKLQYFGHLMRRVDSLEKTLMLGGIGGQEEKGTTEDEMAGWHHRLDGREFE